MATNYSEKLEVKVFPVDFRLGNLLRLGWCFPDYFLMFYELPFTGVPKQRFVC